MKLTFLSKVLRTLSLMVMLSVVVDMIVQQPVQAAPQTKDKTEAGTACVPLPEGGFFYELQGITFTPEQAAAYDKLSAKLSAREAERAKGLRTEEIPGAPLDIEMKDGSPEGIGEEIIKAQDAMIRRNVFVNEQLKLLTQKYGQYAIFYKPRTTVFTPEQLASQDKDMRADEAEMMATLTPQQQKVYQANLVRRGQLEACNTKN
jgi:hypothetical protein